MPHISINTLLGIIIGVGLFMVAIINSTDNYLMFLSISSLYIVLGGTIASTMIAYHGRYVIKTIFALFSIIIPLYIKPKTLFKEVEKVINLAKIKRKEGVFGVERALSDEAKKDPFIKFCLNLLTSEYETSEMKEMMENAIESNHERASIQANILESMAGFAPAYGMIGTLVGLIIMLEKMGSDVTKIGPGLAVALITTLYGAVLAQIIFKPASEKVRQKLDIKRFREYLLAEGFLLLHEGKDSITIQDRLNSFLEPKKHFNVIK
jgi:chemotaxis protein MotA